MSQERDYVLGTHAPEIQRLGLQHYVWQPHVLKCWHEAGITLGSKVLDIGAGPGYATRDLANIVGDQGHITAVERSTNFVAYLKQLVKKEGLPVDAHELDLMTDPIPGEGYDFSWCRWVNSFVSDPSILVEKNWQALRPGGKAIFHEYMDYGSWKFAPESSLQKEFMQEVMKSWREMGGKPSIGPRLLTLLAERGFRLDHVKPLIFMIKPTDVMWHWPLSFVEVNLDRQLELGRIKKEWAEAVLKDIQDFTQLPHAYMTTPMLVEIVATKI